MHLLVCLLSIMTTESTCSYHFTRKHGTRHSFIWTCIPIINYAVKSEVAIALHLYAQYTALQMSNSVRIFSATNWNCFRKCRRIPQQNKWETILCYRKSIALSAKWTGTQRRKKVKIRDTCIVRTAVIEKSSLRTKQHQAVKKSSL